MNYPRGRAFRTFRGSTSATLALAVDMVLFVVTIVVEVAKEGEEWMFWGTLPTHTHAFKRIRDGGWVNSALARSEHRTDP